MKAGAGRALFAFSLLCVALVGAGALAQQGDASRVATPSETATQAPPSRIYRLLSADDLLLLDTTKGRVVIEILPELAPDIAVEVRALARQGFFDDMAFDRVIDGFRVELALPPAGEAEEGAADGGGPPAPAYVSAPALVEVADSDRGRASLYPFQADAYRGKDAIDFGIYKGLPVASSGDAAWPTHCPGVASYEPAAAPGDAPRLFIMRGDAPALDAAARPWGVVVSGLEVVYDLAVGDAQRSGFEPDRLLAVRVASDAPWTSFEAREDVAVLTVLDETGPGFAGFVASLREELERDPRVCEIRLPMGPSASGLIARSDGP